LTVAVLALGALVPAPVAVAASAPQIFETWVTDVTPTSANLRARIDPGGNSTTYRFEYLSEAAYEANLNAVPPREGFFGAAKAPPSGATNLGSVTNPTSVVQHAGSLNPATIYRYRAVATNSAGPAVGVEHVFATRESTNVSNLPDARAWEMVSPPDKGGGAVAAPGALFGGGDLQAAGAGGAFTYGSATAFGGAHGAPPASQYIARRTGSGWVSENVSPPIESAAYGDLPDGVPYRLFSDDLGHSLLFGGLPCRGALPGCPAPNPALPGSGAPAGYMAYYLRDSAGGAFASLLSAAELAHSSVSAEHFEVDLVAATPDLAHVVLSSCAALTANATEVPAGPGECDPAKQNLYEWSAGALSLLNLLPGDVTGTPGAQIAASLGAVSANGARVYWSDPVAGKLYLRDGGVTKLLDEGGGSFEAASTNGAVAFFTKAGHLFRYDAAADTSSDLTPAGGVAGVLGVADNGAYVYYQDAAGLQQWHEGSIAQIAPGPDVALASDYPPSIGTARVSFDGAHLAFLSDLGLEGHDNVDAKTGKPDTELYLYGPPLGGGVSRLACASCNPTGERPKGPASIPGALVNGSPVSYKPRALTSGGNRVFFTSSDALLIGDSNSRPDVYQWEAQGVGSCARAPGCLGLISKRGGASFVDASADGADVFFLTDESLLNADPGSIDLYDSRVGGGFPEAQTPIACIADACQALPSPPDDPTPGTLTPNSGNPPLRYFKQQQGKKHKPKKHHRHKHHKGHGTKRGGGR
jgi:hypothetical protein